MDSPANASLIPGTVTFLAGSDTLAIPISSIDAFNDESISIVLNYAFQTGACFILLLVLLVLTPPAKLWRVNGLLHISGLLICIIRTSLLIAWYLSPLNHFYEFWAADYSSVPPNILNTTMACNAFSALLVIVIEIMLIHQAWAMVKLWPPAPRFLLVGASAIISLLVVGWRFACTVIQNRGVLGLVNVADYAWVVYTAVALNTLSIAWYCALFNVKLVMHLLAHKGILSASPKQLTPMEVLIMTNGILMIIPVLFAGLEWGKFPNFESASLTQSSVVLVLPLGTLAAQQLAARTLPSSSDKPSDPSGIHFPRDAKFPSVSTGSTPTSAAFLSHPADTTVSPRSDPYDWELQQIDSEGVDPSTVPDLEALQKETRA